jgi:hypothetical protein
VKRGSSANKSTTKSATARHRPTTKPR